MSFTCKLSCWSRQGPCTTPATLCAGPDQPARLSAGLAHARWRCGILSLSDPGAVVAGVIETQRVNIPGLYAVAASGTSRQHGHVSSTPPIPLPGLNLIGVNLSTVSLSVQCVTCDDFSPGLERRQTRAPRGAGTTCGRSPSSCAYSTLRGSRLPERLTTRFIASRRSAVLCSPISFLRGQPMSRTVDAALGIFFRVISRKARERKAPSPGVNESGLSVWVVLPSSQVRRSEAALDQVHDSGAVVGGVAPAVQLLMHRRL